MSSDALAVREKVKSETPPARRVLFVCSGNTCRSPMAAAVLNDLAAKERLPLVAFSAGLSAFEGEPITPAAARALEAAGVLPQEGNDYRVHRARRVRASILEEADEVIAITDAHAMGLLLQFPAYASKISVFPQNVEDPFGGDDETYRRCLSVIAAGIRARFGGGAL